MLIGNAHYNEAKDVPSVVPVFPLLGALLLPRGDLPLNIFEPRYLAMIDYALASDRLIGMVQPSLDLAENDEQENPTLCQVGCAGRITNFQESGDGRYIITLTGVVRFKVEQEIASEHSFRLCRISSQHFADDFTPEIGQDAVDRKELLSVFKEYLDANGLEADWSSVEQATNEILVNALSMMSPFGPPEKQALLEANSLKMRADTLVALTEVELARDGGQTFQSLQ